ncbi:MAG: class I SAM-dependent rRNA methyltransferase [Alphaproteobacteria bacterium]
MSTGGDRPVIRVQAGRHKRVRLGHPWIFSNEIEMTAEARALTPGTEALFVDQHGSALGSGYFNPHSLIAGRIVARDGAAIDGALIEDRLGRALSLRERLYDAPFYRLVHSEADALPGLIVDRYGDVLVVQINAAGMELLTDELIAALRSVVAPTAILLRNDGSAREQEGLETEVRWIGTAPEMPIEIVEDGTRFLVDLGEGQKTGWFYDQRPGRTLVASLAAGASVLDLYCYLGAFGVRAAAAGARGITAIDRSQPALDLAARAAVLNGVEGLCDFRRAAVFDALEEYATSGARFDIVVADPPAFVRARRDIKSGARGYRKLARLSAKLVAEGGLLFAASCSHHVGVELFAEQVRRGLADAGRTGRILTTGGAGPDHPVHPFLPESAYLKYQLLQLD